MSLKKSQLLSIIFYVAYFFIIFSNMCSQVKGINRYFNYFEYLSTILLFIVFIIQSKNYKLKSVFFSLLIIILAVISCYYSKDKTMLILVMLILTFKDLDFDNFIKKDFFFKIVLMLVVIFCNFLDLTDDVFVYRDGILRNAFGFRHPNIFAMYLMMCCLELYYINRNRNVSIPLIFSILTSIFIYICVDSRTTIIIILLASLLILINKISKNKLINKKIFKITFNNLFIVLTLLSLILSYKFSWNNEFMRKLNILLSYRLSLNQYFISTYGISLFGSNIETTKTLILDNAYINIILKFGLTFIVFLSINFNIIIKKIYSNKNYVLLIIFIVLMIYGFSESFLYKVSTNAFLLYLGKIYNE